MEENGQDEPPPFSGENGDRLASAHAVENPAVDASKKIEGPGGLTGGQNADAKEQKIEDEHEGRDRDLVVTKDAGKLLAEGGEGKAQAGATFMAAGGVDAHKRPANGAQLGARLLFAAAKESAHRIFPAFHAPPPTVG